MSHLTDEELVRRVTGGDVAAYETLVKKYERFVFGVAFQLLANVEDARDVSQNTFIRAFTRLDQVRDASRLRFWLRQIAVSESQAWRQKNRYSVELSEDSFIVDAFANADEKLLIGQGLKGLDGQNRMTVALFYWYAYSHQEIADLLDEPVTTIKSRLRNAKDKLRKELGITLKRNQEQDPLAHGFAARVTQIIEAAQVGDEATVLELISKEPELLDAREEPGRHTPLHIAAASGNAAIVELLLAHGANLNALDTSDNAMPKLIGAGQRESHCLRIINKSRIRTFSLLVGSRIVSKSI